MKKPSLLTSLYLLHRLLQTKCKLEEALSVSALQAIQAWGEERGRRNKSAGVLGKGKAGLVNVCPLK